MRQISLTSAVFASIVLTGAGTTVFAETIQVPQDHESIQAAINAAKPGDVVLVSAGVYRERLQLSPGVTVKSAGDSTKGTLGLKRAESTVINGDFDGAEGPGVLMTEHSIIDGGTFHVLAGSGKQVTVQDGPWKLVATYGKTPHYALFNVEADPQLKSDLAEKLDQITFRLRGLLERQEALEDQAAMKPGRDR